MQWNKFTEFAATHLELGPCLDEQIRPLCTTGRTIQSVVEQHLDYIAVRPWEKLNLKQTGFYRHMGESKEGSVTYTVYAHIDGQEGPCTRAQASYGRDNSTIEGMINAMKEWHGEYWAKQENRPLVFDVVVRTSRLAHRKAGDRHANKRTISVYYFPEGYNA